MYRLKWPIIMMLMLQCVAPRAQSIQDCQVPSKEKMIMEAKNVYGDPLMSCCVDPLTGFYRNGVCLTGAEDHGTHIICAIVTQDFLDYSKTQGNDLITPRPEYSFPGLKAGDGWCLCISRWLEAVEAGVAPPVNLAATHEKALQYTSLELLTFYDVAKQN